MSTQSRPDAAALRDRFGDSVITAEDESYDPDGLFRGNHVL